MGHSQSTIAKAIKSVLGPDGSLYSFPGDPLYKVKDVKNYNLMYSVKPTAITYPKTKEQVAAIIKCAVDAGLKVQARCGGHSYANYCLGGQDGAVVIDMRNFQHFSMDTTTWLATAGGGTLLGDLTKRMHTHGNRAMAHGTCPQVGIGGHATIGGLGPSSRMWGSALDHIVEIEVVLADSRIIRASETQNSDVFWAVKGAGASFGVVTEFVLRTEADPGECVQFSFCFTVGSYASMGVTFKAWLAFVSDPSLTRKFSTEVVFTALGMVLSGTYFGSREEYDALSLSEKFPGHQSAKTLVFKDWLGVAGHWAETTALQLGGNMRAPMYTKSLAFNNCHVLPSDAVDRVLAYLDDVEKGTLVWFVIFDLEGGAVNDVPQDATAYAHRDALFYLQSYAVGVPKVTETIKDFLRGLNKVIRDSFPGGEDFGAYAGYVDPELENGQHEYWRGNLPRLERIKKEVDPGDVFHNPQSVRPAGEKADVKANGTTNGVENGLKKVVPVKAATAVANGKEKVGGKRMSFLQKARTMLK